MVRHLMIGAVVLASAGHALAQDLTAGEAAFRKCQPCHDVGEAAKNKLGPELNGLARRFGEGELLFKRSTSFCSILEIRNLDCAAFFQIQRRFIAGRRYLRLGTIERIMKSC